MATRTKKISTLIESQLPGFISSEYENFSKFVEKYYEQLESTGQPLDIINNISKYRDINYYENNLLNQNTSLSESILSNFTTILVEDASSFPKQNGYIRIGKEICFYKERTDTEFLEVSRGVSGNTTLGDLYNSTEFITTQASPHYEGDKVYNVSNLFLYAFVKNFEEEYLGAFPEKYLKGQIDKRTLIKNINKFYKAKGTDRSIKFIFNSIISQDPEETVEVYNPKDYTLKASVSDWITKYALKVKVLSGDPSKLVGNVITQSLDDYDKSITFASAVVDNVFYLGKFDGEDLYEIILEPSTVNGNFKIAAKTTLRSNLSASLGKTGRIDIFSTMGFSKQGKVLVGGEVISFNDKNVNQLIIDERPTPSFHASGSQVYSFSTIKGLAGEETVRLLTLGVLYNLLPEKGLPYSESGDLIQVSESGFETIDPIIYNPLTNSVRWLLNTDFTKVNSLVPGVNAQVGDLNADVSAIYEDEQYYYIASSSFPSHSDLLTLETIEPLSDQKYLKLIRKYPTTTTEVYETSTRDVGIAVDGSPIFSYKDFDSISFGEIETIKIESKGTGYAGPPTVLINEQPGKALASMSGETLDKINLISNDVYTSDPIIRITSGEGAKLSPVVTEGRISSINVINPGKYYSSPPIIRIIDELGKGNFAEYQAILDNEGRIASCKRISGGRFYTRGNVIVTVEPVGKGAQATSKIKRWVKNRYEKLKTSLDTNNSYVFPSFDGSKEYGYGVVANPVILRKRLDDNINAAYEETSPLKHSPIIGYAYDGNPIYGPYGYSNPLNSQSPITRLLSGYVLNNSRPNGPSISEYSLGTFVDDYIWIPSVNSGKTELDPNNGRFCVTPDYPNGTYAYFLTIDENNTPKFPYVLGKNFYSLPVDSNFNSIISQDDIPVSAKRLKSDDFEVNGKDFYAYIQDVKGGNVSSATVYNSTDNFSVNSFVAINDFLTEGSGAAAVVSSVKGKDVVSIESNQTKAVQITIVENAYLFSDDTITQNSTGASGKLIGDVVNSNLFVLRDVQGKFNSTDVVSSETKVITLILDKNSIFTQGETVTLTDGKAKVDSDIATGIILEGIARQNSLKVKVTSGDFIVDTKYFLRSSNLGDTSRTKILNIFSLSENLNIFNLDENIAIVETSEPHNIAIGDKVDVDVLPNDNETETTYYVRKRLYQEAILSPINHSSTIVDTGIGSADVLNSGADYESGVYENIELIFQDVSKARKNIGRPGDSGNAKARITVSNPSGLGYGSVAAITLIFKGSGYKTGDVLTVNDADLNRLTNTGNTQRLYVAVDHVGFAEQNTTLRLSNVRNLSIDDYLKLNKEIVKITSVDVLRKTVTVLRGQKNTRPRNHFNGLKAELFEGNYRFTDGYFPFGDGVSKPTIINYDSENKKIFVTFNYGAQNPERILQSSIFFDSSSPAKLVTIKSVETPKFKLEFSKDTEDNLITNPIINIQKYYKYKFDTSHFSMSDTYLDFSSSSNYNIFTEEKFVSQISPGNLGSFVTIKLGFGPVIASNNFQLTRAINFSNYFYFIKVSPDVNTDNSFLKIIDDPLIGEKIVKYSTDTKFVYSLESLPEYDGSGSMNYTTTSKFAVGEINSISITNTGNDYKKIPVVDGVLPSSFRECIVDPVYDTVNKNIAGFKILNSGSNYSQAKVVIVDGDGSNYEFACTVVEGKIIKIDVINPGVNFTYKPSVKIVESDLEIYLNSKNIGIPQNVKIVNNGALFNSDKTTLPEYKSTTTFILTNFDDTVFYPGETIIQPSTGATAKVAKNGWRSGSNLLKVEKIKGVFKLDDNIIGKGNNRQGTIRDEISTVFVPQIKSFYDNLGFYSSDKGKIGANSQRLTDSYFYQDYSYVIKSNTSIDVWRELIKETTHPAGFQLFGEMKIDSEGQITMPSEQHAIQTFVSISLDSVNVTVIDTRRQITNSFVNLNNLNVEKGLGAVSVDTFDSSETLAYRVKLSNSFDGDYNSSTGLIEGNTSFTLIDVKNNLPLVLDNSQQLFVTLDGIFQEPGVAYTVSGSTITFASPPLGIRLSEGQEVPPQHFYGKAIKFKDTSLSEKYFKKLKSIVNQFDGIQNQFNLYYEDGSIVKTDNNENLIVSINGVIQNAKINEFEPFNNSYYILRSENPSVTDKIVFSSPPIDQKDLYEDEELPTELKGYEKCFIYSVSNYQRFTIDSSVIEYRGGGPYLIVDEIEGRVKKIDEPLYAFVFVDGVLQEEIKSYQIVGPNITFTSPLKKFTAESGEITYQKVSIILIYGRDLEKTLTFYDFEPDTYFNVIKLRLQGENIYDIFYDVYKLNPSNNIVLYQNDNVIGKIKKLEKTNNNDIYVTVIGNNLNALSEDILKIVDFDSYELITEFIEIFPEDDGVYDWLVTFSNDVTSFNFVSENFSTSAQNPTLNIRQGNTLNLNISGLFSNLAIVDKLEFVQRSEVFFDLISVFSENQQEYQFFFVDSVEPNPSITVRQGDLITFNIDTNGRSVTIVEVSEGNLEDAVVVSENIIGNGTSFGTIIWDTSSISLQNQYYYVNVNNITEYGQIYILPYEGIYWKEENEVAGVINNGESTGIISWELSELVSLGKYYYVSTIFGIYGEINVLSNTPTLTPVSTSINSEYLIEGSYTIEAEYLKDSSNDRILAKNIPGWLFNTKLGDDAWENRSKLYGNLISGDKIQIDGEFDYREILRIPNYANTRQYNDGEIVTNQIYSKVKATNYNGITRGEGLSITANLTQSGSINSLSVSGLDWNKRDLEIYFKNNILLQPTAYQYFTTPVVYFIPVDGNGGGAKADVISFNGQILDVILLNGGYGYTKPPKVVVARRYNRIKQNSRKIDSITDLTITPIIAGFEYVISSSIEISGAAGSEQAITSIITLGGFVGKEQPQRDITTIIAPKAKILSTTQKKFDTFILFEFKPNVILISDSTAIIKEITSIIDARINVIPSSTIQSISKELTKKIIKIVNNSIIETAPESVNDIGAFLDAPLSETDTIVYIADTRRFPDASRLLIGKEIVTYNGKLSDRFLNVVRGAFGTTATTHQAGDYLRHLPELVSIVPVGPTTSIISEVTLIETYSTSTSLIRVFSTLADDVVEVSIQDDTDIQVTAQKQINIDNTNTEIDREILISLPLIYFDVLNSYSSTYVSFSAGGVFDVITQTSSIVSTIQSTDIQITNTFGIDIDNSDTIISTQTIVSAESSFESTSSTVVTLITSDSKLTSVLQIEALSTFNAYSTTIIVGADVNITSITTELNSIESIGQEIVIIPPTTYVTSLNSYSSTFVSYTVGGVFDVITQTSSIVSAIESTDIEITSTFDIDIDYTDIQLEKEIVIIPPTTYVTSLNSYSSTFVSIGYATIETIISSSTSTLQSVDIEIINTFDIDVDNSNTIISTQLVTSAESSFESTSSTIVTLTSSDSNLTSSIQIEGLTTFNAYSTTIIVGADVNISSISSAFNSVESIGQEIIIIPPTTYVTSLNSHSSTFVSIGYATVEAIISSSVSTIQSVDIQITNTFDINVDNTNTIISSEFVTSVESSFESYSSAIISTVYDSILVTNISQIEESSAFNAYSTVISVGIQSGISTISTVRSSIETTINEFIIGTLLNNVAAINAFSTALSTVIAGVDNPIIASSSLLTTIQSVNNEITTSFTSVEKHPNLITSTQIIADIGQNLGIISTSPVSSDYVTTILTITANITTIAANKLAKNADVERFYKTGIIDYLVESILLIQFIPTRTELITLESPINEIYQRNGEIIDVTNKASFEDASVESYTPANSGFTLKTFENNVFVNTGSYGVNGSIESLTLAYPTLTFKDFEERPNSAITRSGQTFNLGIPTINSSGTFISDDIDDNQNFIMVQSTTGFPSSGKLLLGKEIIYYAQKTSTSFIGVLRGIDNTIPDEHLSGDYLRTFD